MQAATSLMMSVPGGQKAGIFGFRLLIKNRLNSWGVPSFGKWLKWIGFGIAASMIILDLFMNSISLLCMWRSIICSKIWKGEILFWHILHVFIVNRNI